MTNRELSQLYYLNREIVCLRQQIAAIESRAESVTQVLSDMPRGSGTADKVSRAAVTLAAIRDKYHAKMLEASAEHRLLLDYIDGIEDSMMRQIMQYRHISGMSWAAVAAHIGGGNTADSVRMAHDRYLQANP